MKTWIVSYSDAAFLSSLERLMESAMRYGIDERRPWRREDLECTSLYRLHKATLDLPRGGGYWLWKSFIIKETLKEMAAGDLLVYCDAGIAIVADLGPLFRLCVNKTDLVLFAGHYDDVGGPGPNLCGKWTKRDCFVAMDCDEPRYHEARMLDASFMVIEKTPRSTALVREWLLYCCQPQLLTDAPNVCGLPNLPTFVQHRHDQSLLSILAAREALELFRHPSQYGNHLKEERYREAGEWTRDAYGAKGIYRNSPYPTLLDHHRGRLGQSDLWCALRREVPAPADRVFEAWNERRVLQRWSLAGRQVVEAEADVRVGGRYQLTIAGGATGGSSCLTGTYVEVEPPTRLVYTWPWQTRVTVQFDVTEGGTSVALTHEPFPTEKLRASHTKAWNDFLDVVVACCAART